MNAPVQRVVRGQGPPIHLGISTCPNDTFAFAGLIDGLVDPGGLEWTIDLLDITQLNEGLFAGRFDVAKTSFHAALKMADRIRVLPVGSALGFGVGPLLLASTPNTFPRDATQLTLCPGAETTAAFLFDMFYPETTRVDHVVFSDVMPRLQKRQADFGVCIHEGRFTFAESGLHLVADMGQLWEDHTASPLPLGGLVIRDHHHRATIDQLVSVIDASLAIARDNSSIALPAMRRFAQEFDDGVLMQHVELYVNDWTVDLGPVGRRALETMSRVARDMAVGSAEGSEKRVFPGPLRIQTRSSEAGPDGI